MATELKPRNIEMLKQKRPNVKKKLSKSNVIRPYKKTRRKRNTNRKPMIRW